MIDMDRSPRFETQDFSSSDAIILFNYINPISLGFSISLIVASFVVTRFFTLFYCLVRAIRRNPELVLELTSYLDDYHNTYLDDLPLDDSESSDHEDLVDGFGDTDREESRVPESDVPSGKLEDNDGIEGKSEDNDGIEGKSEDNDGIEGKSEDNDGIEIVCEGDESSQGADSVAEHNKLPFLNLPLSSNQPSIIDQPYIASQDDDEQSNNDGDLLDKEGWYSVEDDDYSFEGKDFDRMCDEILHQSLSDEGFSFEGKNLDILCDDVMQGGSLEELLESVTFEHVMISSICAAVIIKIYFFSLPLLLEI